MSHKQITNRRTFASLSIWLQAVSSGAGAEVAALCVFAQEVTRLRRQSALIHIWKTQTRIKLGISVTNQTLKSFWQYSVWLKRDRDQPYRHRRSR